MITEHVPVLVAGGGTVGLSTALFLAHQGIETVVVERNPGPSGHPRALGVGIRGMEPLRQLGLEPAVAAAARPARAFGRLTMHTVAGTDLSAADRGGFPSRSEQQQLSAPISPVTAGACTQDRLDPVLLTAATERGATVRYGTKLVSFSQDPERVTAVVEDGATGARRTVTADYLIGADGGRSRVRRALGVGTSGPGRLGNAMINVLFRADLSPLVGEHQLGMVHITNPVAEGILIPVDDEGLYTFHISFDPDQKSPEDFPLERCHELVQLAIGSAEIEVEVLSALPWSSTALVADQFRDRRVFLVGDAAHVVPPTGGFGLNTGIADAQNLAWKLAMVLNGSAGSALLDTYDSERRPIAEFSMEQVLLRGANRDLHWDFSKVAERERLGIVDIFVAHAGYHYAAGAVIGPRTELPSLTEAVLDGTPGTRAPHVWVERNGQRISTLDLVDSQFTLLTGPDGQAWCAAAPSVAEGSQVKLSAHQIGAGCAVADEDGAWHQAANLHPDGALLVRPDGIVAWRSPSTVPNPAQTLKEVITQLLARTPLPLAR